LGGPTVQIVQPRYGSTVGFRGMTDIRIVFIVIVIDYLVVGPGSAPSDWAMVLGMYGTHLKYRQCLHLFISIT